MRRWWAELRGEHRHSRCVAALARAPLSPQAWREFVAFRQAMRAQPHETVIDAQGLLRSGLVTWLARGRKHGYDRESVRERAASWFYDERHRVDRSLHAITRNRMLTGQVLGYAPEEPLDFGLDRAALMGAALTREVVLLHATARPEKEWPVANWIEVGASPCGARLRAGGAVGHRSRTAAQRTRSPLPCRLRKCRPSNRSIRSPG